MCGRCTLRSNAKAVADLFGLLSVPELAPHYNIAPSQLVAVVRSPTGTRELVFLKWGFVPFNATDPAVGNKMINARCETVATKWSFKKAFESRRCLVVADGFYEWKKVGNRKQPYFIRLKIDQPFGFAGLWERNEVIGNPIESCTIITTNANQLVAPLHDRMPVIIPPGRYDFWLDPHVRDKEQLEKLLTPYPSDEMVAYPVSTLVSSPENDLAKCIEPVRTLDQPRTLF